MYQQTGGSNKLYWRTGFGWVISSQQPGSGSKGGIMSASDTACPIYALHGSWKYYDGKTYDKADSTMKVLCQQTATTKKPAGG